MTKDRPPSLDAYRGARSLVLGASGFIGRHVALQLSRAGADLHVAVRDRARAEEVLGRCGIRAPIHAADLCRPEEVATLLRDVEPAITFNLAGYGVDREERDEAAAGVTNDGLVVAVADALALGRARWPGRALVHVGSALEYGRAKGDLAEETPCRPTTLYGRTKLAGTLHLASAAQASGLQSLTARLFTVYGPGEHAGRLLPSLVAAAGSGADLPLTEGLQMRDFTFVEDAPEGLLRLGLTSGPPGEVVNLATGRLSSVRDFARTAARLLGIPAERLRFGALPVRDEEMSHDPVRIDRLRALTGWAPNDDLEAGIRRALGSGIGFS